MTVCKRSKHLILLAIIACFFVPVSGHSLNKKAESILERIGLRKGVCAILGLPEGNDPEFIIETAKRTDFLVFFQTDDPKKALKARKLAKDQ